MTIVSTGLSNELIGGPNAIQGAIRFRAAHSSPLCSLRCYDIDHAQGYSGGGGGTLDADLHKDTVGGISNVLFSPGILLANGEKASDPEFPDPATGRGRFPLVTFAPQVTLVKGGFYCILITDSNPTPKTNFFSMDYLYHATKLNQVPDTSIWIRAGVGPWKLVPYLIPSPLVFHYANGLWQGLGWIAAPGGVLEEGTMYGFPKGSCV